jgi:NAD-dependent SIR2 family protein deacetylase
VIDDLRSLVRAGGVLVLSGAGISTESGIPDYRGPSSVGRTAQPMTYQEFLRAPEARQRYWARSHLGWQAMSQARPNAGHRAVASLQQEGLIHGLITQNVDGLHQAGGATEVIELHGALSRVVCLDCGARTTRAELHERIAELNPGWAPTAERRPDGDVALEDVGGFRTADCETCGGRLKPDVVFFGENVPADRVSRSFSLTASASSVLVLGSSLTVRSGYRFVLRAAQQGTPVAIVNQGPTRADELADVRVDAPLGDILTDLVQGRLSA